MVVGLFEEISRDGFEGGFSYREDLEPEFPGLFTLVDFFFSFPPSSENVMSSLVLECHVVVLGNIIHNELSSQRKRSVSREVSCLQKAILWVF